MTLVQSKTPNDRILRVVTAPFEAIARHWTILWRTSVAEIRATHAGSVFGAVWLVLGPLMMLAVYAVTFAVIFQFRPSDLTITEYVLYVFCGIVAFLMFSAALSAGSLSLVSSRSLLLNTVFPAELIPLRSVLVASVVMPTGIGVLFVGDLLFSRLSLTWLLVPVVMLLELMFLAGLCWVLSLVALLFRDIGQMISYIVMMLMVLTPIAYTPSMIPPQLVLLIYLNPASYFVISIQSLIVLNELPSWKIFAVMVVMSTTVFIAGFHLCRNAKSSFYDFA